jgi:guanine nucleotide-binding protein subunit alpha
MKSLIRGYMLTGKKISSKLKEDVTKIGEADSLTEEIASSIESVWKSDSIKKTFERRSELKIQIPGCANYYFENVLRYAESTFVATKEDIMHCKLKTTGTQELKFEIGGRLFSITDVGGQRSERRKWLFVFTGVRAVIFLAALDEYDLVLEEDDKTNRFTESLDLFRTVTGSQFLEKSSWILFLNKSDLLREKLPKYPLNKFFNDISEKDGADFDAAVKYLQQKFVKSWKGKTELFHFITCNVNTELTDRTFQSVRSMLVSDALEDAGF